eukprot:7988425-Alexandrium_andersonii.AAC.1
MGPGFDVRRSPYFDLLDDGVYAWILQVVSAGRVATLHLAPPCATFSLARKPALRGRSAPWGYDPSEARAHAGNRLFARC